MDFNRSELLQHQPSKSGKPFILLADDDEAFRTAVGSLLLKSGYKVTLASNGCEALELMKSQPVDLAILDLIMPQMEGIETIMKIRELDSAIKVVAISGGGRIAGDNYLDIARKLGASAVLAKPFTSELLLAAIDRAMQRSSTGGFRLPASAVE